MLMQWLSIYNRNKKRRVRLPAFSDNPLVFRSVNRVGSTVVNKIDKLMNGELYNPLTDVIDLEKYTIIENGVTDGEGYVWDTVTILTIIDDVIDDLTFKIVRNFNDFQAVNNGRSSTNYYIMSNNIDCSEAQTMKPTTSSSDYDAETRYNSGDIITWTDAEGNIDRYIKTPYITNYVAGKVPTDTDTNGQRYWEKYNYEGFLIDGFGGVFSGNGFELQNCYVNNTGDYTGVFSYLNGGKLSNIGVTGSVVGYGMWAGGLVGYNYTSSITNSYSTCSVIGYDINIGGLVGYSRESSITNSYSTGSVIGVGTYTGGLAGSNKGSSITNSYSTGSVIGYRESVGGLVGYNDEASPITNSYSTCSVIGYDWYVGGLVGGNDSPSSTTNSYWDTEASGQSESAGGIGLTTAEMKEINNYLPEWDFSNTWAIDDGYPYLRMQVNKIDDSKNGKLVYNPLTDVIDINDTVKYPRGETTTGSGDTLHVWETVKLLTKLDDVIENKTFKIVKDFNDFQAVNNGRSKTDYYIMADNIDCSASKTMKETIADENFDSSKDYSLEENLLTVVNYQGSRYIKTPYITNYEVGKTPEDTDTEGQKYWHIYNYQGFWINEFSGVFSGNGFELQNCYVNKVSTNAGVFSYLNHGGKLSNVGVTGSVIGYGNRVGGLAGNSYSLMTNSYSTCSVIGYGTDTGGLVGNSHSSSIITNSYSTGSVIGYGANVGGLAGVSVYVVTITNSYSTGLVIGYATNTGGLAGTGSSSIVTNSYWDTETSGQTTSRGGKGLTTTEMKDIDNYLEWDFTNVWGIDPAINDGYPYLRMQFDNLANPISNSRIVNNYDGYIMMPSNISININGVPKPLFNKDDTVIYNDDARNSDLCLSNDGMGDEYAYYWHISELNTTTILSYMNPDYKNSWFVKNTFDGTRAKTVKEIFSFTSPVTDTNSINRIMRYLGIGD